MKICANCKKEIGNDSAVFCSACGCRLTEEAVRNEPEERAAESVPAGASLTAKKKTSSERRVALLAGGGILVLVGVIAILFASGIFPGGNKKTDKAIELIEAGEWREGLAVLDGEETELARQLVRYCGIEEAREDFVHALRRLVFHSIDSEYDGVVGGFLDVIFGIDAEEFGLLPDSLKRNIIFYTLVCKMAEDYYPIPYSEESDPAFLDSFYRRMLFQTEPYFGLYSPDDFWGLDIKDSFQTVLAKFGNASYSDMFSEEYHTASNTESLQMRYENVNRTGLCADRDVTYYLLTGRNIDRRLNDIYTDMD